MQSVQYPQWIEIIPLGFGCNIELLGSMIKLSE